MIVKRTVFTENQGLDLLPKYVKSLIPSAQIRELKDLALVLEEESRLIAARKASDT